MTSTDLILEINRIPKGNLSSDIVHNRISEYFVNNGQSSLGKWQINAVVRQMMAGRVSVTHEDLQELTT